ncbi:MAG: hypothetical protein E7398_00125 [Ruminococcaceae bacterium]|nr:hypothetical protein [Oscillospiraceae bacterium]
MRDRLIELLNKKYDHFCDQCGVNKDSHYTDSLADYLLANGVIVPPVVAGDKVYRIVDMSKTACRCFVTEETVEKYTVVYKNILGNYNLIPFDDFGKTVFLTKEEAEAALRKEGEKNDK